jgi:hypothetical protein
MDRKCTSIGAAPALLVMVSSVNLIMSLPHYVICLHVRSKVYSEKGNLVTNQTLLKFFSGCVSSCGI